MVSLKILSVDNDYGNNGTRNTSNYNRLFLSLVIGFIIGSCLGYLQIIFSNSKHLYEIYTPCETTSSVVSVDNYQPHIGVGKKFGKFSSFAHKIFKEVKVLCWILTSPNNHMKRARHIRKTWGKRCNKLIFVSSEDDNRIGAIGFNVSEGRDFLWEKTRAGFEYIYENFLDDYDWFLKADDDTYVVMENLRFLLASHDSNIPIYFGSKFQLPGASYMSGGAGYVLSKGALKRLVEVAFENDQICRLEGFNEDFEMGLCLQSVGVIAGDTRDEKGKTRFHPLGINILRPNAFKNQTWLWKYQYYRFNLGLDHVSDKAISFHYVNPNQMYLCEFLIYHFQPYGFLLRPKPIPKVKFTYEEEIQMIKISEKDRNLKGLNVNNFFNAI